MQSFSPTARRYELAARLRQLRMLAGRTVEDAARELMCSPAKISRLETAGRGVHARDVRDLCRLYSAPDPVRDELMLLALEAKKPGWWHAFHSLDEPVVKFIGLESAARTVLNFDPLRIPGLLQTTEYTIALLADIRGLPQATPSWLQETVAARTIRQQRYRSGETSLHAIIDEAVLHRPIGGAAVMGAQIDRLLQDANLPTIRLQVVPYSVGAYPGLHGAFCHMGFKSDFLSDVVYLENVPTDFILAKSEDTDRYRQIFNAISLEFALSPVESTNLLHQVRSNLSDSTHLSET